MATLVAWPAHGAAAGPAEPAAVPLSTDQANFVLANTAFAVLHEFGHAIIRDFDVPLLGLEEDSADTLATMAVLDSREGKADPDAARRRTRGLVLAAVGNALIWKTGAERKDKELVLWAQHNLSVRRAARIACLIYGSDPVQYAWMADSTHMPDFRRDGCEDEFGIARRAAAWVAGNFGVPKSSADAAPQVQVVYGEARDPALAGVRDFLRESRVLETHAALVDGRFAFRAPLKLRARACGGPNAYWDPDNRELLICYELVQGFMKLSADPDVARAYATVRELDERGPVAGEGTPR